MGPRHFIAFAPLTPETCKEWAITSYWTVEEAVLLSMGLDKHAPHDIKQDVAEQKGAEFINLMDSVHRSQYALEQQRKCPEMMIPARGGQEMLQEVVYHPAQFTKWAIDNLPSFHDDLHRAIKERYPTEFPLSQEPLLLNSQKAKERCRVIAEMLWDQDKTIKTKEMIVRPEMKRYGHDGMFEPKTVYGWIKDLSPKNREAGGSIEEIED